MRERCCPLYFLGTLKLAYFKLSFLEVLSVFQFFCWTEFSVLLFLCPQLLSLLVLTRGHIAFVEPRVSLFLFVCLALGRGIQLYVSVHAHLCG